MGTKLERKDVKVFASQPNHATQVSAFLTGKNETPDYTLDPNAIQNTYYPKGWFGDGENDLPQGTDMNGVMYAESYKNAYLYQMGIAEWSITQEYFLNSYCQVAGTVYKSLVNNNIGNNPITDDGTNWKEIPLEPYDGGNLGTAEGIFAGKTTNNVLQFKSLAVSGNGDISSSGDTITIAIGGGGTGDVYWGAIDGTLSNQSDLQQALNQKQNLIGYTPENIANKVTTVRDDTVATNTAYPTELATRTAIDDAISSANTYTDNALNNLSSSSFVLYASTVTSPNGALTTTAPTGNGTEYSFTDVWDDDLEFLTRFSYTTTLETRLNNTFSYDILIPIRNTNYHSWEFEFKLTIAHPDVNNGLEFTIFDVVKDVNTSYGETDFQFKQDLININEIVYPAGSLIYFSIFARAIPDDVILPPYNLDLLVYDQYNPLVISRNRGINRFLATSINTMATSYYMNQESFNVEMYEQIQNKQNEIQGVQFYYDNSLIKQEPDTNRTSYLGTPTHPYNYAYMDQIGDANNVVTTGYLDDTISRIIHTDDIEAKTVTTPIPNTENRNVTINKINVKWIKSDLFGDNSQTTHAVDISCSEPEGTLATATLGEYRKFNNIKSTKVTVSNLSANTNDTAILIDTNLNPDSTANNRKLGSSTNKFYEGWISYVKTSQLEAMAGGTKLNFGYNYFSPATADQYQLGYQNRFLYVYSAHFDQGSDIRNKRNIKDYEESALEKIKNITPITYNYKDEERTTLGVSAQELRELEPLLVNTQKTEDGKDETLGIDVYSLCVFAIKAIKELNEKVETLEARVNELEKGK